MTRKLALIRPIKKIVYVEHSQRVCFLFARDLLCFLASYKTGKIRNPIRSQSSVLDDSIHGYSLLKANSFKNERY